MKPQKIPLEPLRDHLEGRLDEYARKYPDYATALHSLKESALSVLGAESLELGALQEALEAIVKRADELNDGLSFAAAQDVVNKLDSLARATLSEGVPVLPELRVALSVAPARMGGQADQARVEPGSRTRLGGKPDWIQSDATPICERCGKTLTFVAQIDSIANEDSELGRFLSEKASFMFADVGMIYVFWCSTCMETGAVLQCD